MYYTVANVEVLKRLDRLVRSYTLNYRETSASHSADFVAAWSEIERFLADEGNRGDPPSVHSGFTSGILRDFSVLEVSPGSDLSQVRSSYRRLLAQYHPDLHNRNPEKERAAAELTRELTASYERIAEFYRLDQRR